MHRLCIFALLSLITAPLPAQTLRDLAAQRGIRFGAAVDPSHLGESLYADTLAREFNLAEPENALKFTSIHPAFNTYTFAQADSIAAFATAHNMQMRGHTLLWHNQVPSWVTGGSWTPAQLAAILQDHIATVVSRYKDQIYAWDVVNEAFNDNGTLRSTVWNDAPGIGLPGTAYIEQTLRWAHDASPQALLFYNDYSAESLNAKSDAIYNMAKDFKARGVPLSGIGMQMHFTSATPNFTSIEANMKRLADLGLFIEITELDVRIAVDSFGAPSVSLLATQAKIYHDVVASCLKFPNCRTIQTWGFTDKYSWVPSSFPGLGAALEFDNVYQPKSAYAAIADVMSTAPPVIAPGALTSAASYSATAVAPGEIVALFNATWGPSQLVSAQIDSSGRLPTALAGVRLLFDDIPAPLLYAVTGQIAAIAPFALASKNTAQMQYEFQGIKSNAVTVTVAPTHPALFTVDTSGTGSGAILDLDYRLITKTNRAIPGAYIVLYATGGGLISPQPLDGQIATGAADLILKPTVSIGGVDCVVSYAGSAPGIVAGGAQINVLVPAGVPSGEQPIVITSGGVPSQPGVTIWVQ